VGAAASLREPLTRIADAFEAVRGTRRGAASAEPLRPVFAASSLLAAQVRAGAPLDVLVSADARILERLDADGLVARRRSIARNRLVVVVAGDSGLRIEAPADLAQPSVRRIAIPEHAVPVGRYAREWLASRGVLDRLTPRIVRTEHARATLAAVDQGLADAAIVYATDARLARSARVAYVIPEAEQPRIEYAAAVLAASRQPRLARAFLDFLTGETARTLLEDAGFAPPRDPDGAGGAPPHAAAWAPARALRAAP
jgi:molybdate transport system substrate-binding protein